MQPKNSKRINAAVDFDAAWSALIADRPMGRPKGDGWKTAEELSKLMGRGYDSISTYARNMVKDGKFESVMGTNENFRRVVYYRPIARKK